MKEEDKKPTPPSIFTIGIIEDEESIAEEWRNLFEIEIFDKQTGIKKRQKRLDSCQLDFVTGSYDGFVANFKNIEFDTNTYLLDLHLGRLQKSGIDIMNYLAVNSKSSKKPYKVIVISSYCDDFNIATTERLGAAAHVRKSIIKGAKPEFVEGLIQKVWEAEGFVTFLSETAVNKPVPKLSAIQIEMLKLKKEGKDSKEISVILKIKKVTTIDNRFASLRHKFGATNNTQLISLAISFGII